MKTVTFIESITPYVAGDVATFENKEADKYIEVKKAVEFKKKQINKPVVDKMVEKAEVNK